jgi:dTDP-4-dehydrorhamnose reductase
VDCGLNGRIYHICDKGTVSWFEYTKEILRVAGIKNIEVKPITSEELNRPAKRPSFSGLDTSRFEEFTGYKLRTWKNALKEYINAKR